MIDSDTRWETNENSGLVRHVKGKRPVYGTLEFELE